MPSTLYLLKYQVIINTPTLTLNKKYKSVKDILEDLKNTEYPISGRNAIYQIMTKKHKENPFYKYRGIEINKIREPLKIRRRIITEIIADVKETAIPPVRE